MASESNAIAIASGIFADVPHYVTTDAALAFHELIDQPLRVVTVVLAEERAPTDFGPLLVRPVAVSRRRLRLADAHEATIDGFRVRMAGREQAVVDALAEPRWMARGDLVPAVLGAFSEVELARTAAGALARSTAAAQRLGCILEAAGRPVPTAIAELHPPRSVLLRAGRSRRGPYSARWRVYGCDILST